MITYYENYLYAFETSTIDNSVLTEKCLEIEQYLTNIVEAHHLDEDKTNNDPSNLIPLCPNHHQYWHSRYRHLVEDKVYSYIKEWKKKLSMA